MPTSRAYDTRYAIHPNMLTHDLHGPHAVIINMDLRVHGHVLYKRRHACSTTTNGCLGCYIKSTTWPQYKYGILPRVHEHAGSSATHLSLVAHHPFEYRHASAWPIRYKGSAYWGSSRSILAFYMYVNPGDVFKRKLIMAQMLHLGNSHKKLAQSAFQ